MKENTKILVKIICLAICVSCIFASAITSSTALSNSALGDCNGDGAIDCKDVLLMRKYIGKAATEIDFEAGNIFKDNEINTKDVILLRKSLAGLLKLDEYVTPTTLATTTIATTTTRPTLPEDSLAQSIKTVGATMISPISYDTYTLKWIDDFNGDTLDESVWTMDTMNYNAAEESVNRKENIEVKDGLLNIYAKREDREYTGTKGNSGTVNVSNLTSGAINTKDKKSWKYGRLEIKCKFPYSYGMWAAFWTMGQERGWPWCGETDIMEFVGGTAWGNDRDNEYLSNLHWADENLSSEYAWSTNTSVGPLDVFEDNSIISTSKLSCGYTYQPNINGKLYDDWHVCGVEWTDKTMTFYCDKIPYYTVDISRKSMSLAFHQKHFMILNLVMGGSWAGSPNSDTIFPQKLQVDWVKVWQK